MLEKDSLLTFKLVYRGASLKEKKWIKSEKKLLILGWYLRMAEAVKACMSSCTLNEGPHNPYWQLQWVG